jgi:hypothetical protein
VLVDSDHVAPVTPMRWEELRYRPHLARFGGEELVVVVRDRELSDAQEAGMDAGRFVHEVQERTKLCDFPPLVTTCTDGDNGGWFRNTAPEGNFWTVFHHELLERVKNGWSSGICPPSSTTISTGTVRTARSPSGPAPGTPAGITAAASPSGPAPTPSARPSTESL